MEDGGAPEPWIKPPSSAKFAKNEWLKDQASFSKKDSTLWVVMLGELDEAWRLAVYVSRLEVES